ncbi:penicillin-insensitive murein endopeptidase [Azospirillum sp. RWY-5-1]|uniref:Penicillin-insensitive murein endopeptidase n=1 Tax=Azospirillum oleiclasticum TaxID=2735135 RepID=A0ABX2TBS1_9PROT|nr:penicillin-insensitive murein endopeptidase [Azospirillum oleiclasticum]NYZ14219.1 penicillin-insensitive murein endopeptidase [Azospirillum oleiclasticum]NYZ21703.1 penicillin-insensitive murein endopeptidase [Azospirillum oleiclasticum]
MRGVVFGALLALGLATLTGAAAQAQPQKATDRVKGLQAAAWAAAPGPTKGAAYAIGGYAAGCLAGGVALPGEGTGYQAIRLSRQRNFGHPVLVDFVRDFGRRVATAGLGTALIGDMGQARGGPMTFGHASHQIGLDVDVWLRLDLPPMGRAARERLEEIKYVDYDAGRVDAGVWTPAQGGMIRIAASDPRVARIFVHPAIKLALCDHPGSDRVWLRKVRPWYGHDGHMHIRLSCPPGSPQCEEQKELPPGDGCDDDLYDWIRSASRPVVERAPGEAKPPAPALPAACRAVLRGTSLPVVAAR